MNHDVSSVQVAIDGSERLVRDVPQQVAAHRDDLGGGAGRQVEAAEKFLARAVDAFCSAASDAAEDRRGSRAPLRNGERIGLHLVGEKTVELKALLARRLFQLDEQLTRDGDT